jgi:N6-L-threonylcarbamoyladenine synthase
VVPGLAKTAHEENIDGVIRAALSNANMSMEEIDAIGVTVGPGLEICLRVGCNKGRELAMMYNKPFVGVHHLEAHILMARIPPGKYDKNDGGENRSVAPYDEVTTTSHDERAMDFPFLALLVSGGHCQILKCLGVGRYSILGGTLDDSLGEAFDKTARLLGLPVGGGGGPAVEALSAHGDPHSLALPIPMQRRKDCDFSYAGLKTSVRMAAERICVERGLESPEELPFEDKANIAASFQHVAFRHVEVRLGRAMEQVEREDGIRTLAVVGGVAANKELRRRLNSLCSDRAVSWDMHVPPPRLCTDQGAMSAWAAVERLCVGSSDLAEDQDVFARYPFSVSSNGAS